MWQSCNLSYMSALRISMSWYVWRTWQYWHSSDTLFCIYILWFAFFMSQSETSHKSLGLSMTVVTLLGPCSLQPIRGPVWPPWIYMTCLDQHRVNFIILTHMLFVRIPRNSLVSPLIHNGINAWTRYYAGLLTMVNIMFADKLNWFRVAFFMMIGHWNMFLICIKTLLYTISMDNVE